MQQLMFPVRRGLHLSLTTTGLGVFVVRIIGVLVILNPCYNYLYIIRVGRCYTYEI